MDELIRLQEYPINYYLKFLLQDKTSKKNIVYATESYNHMGPRYAAQEHIEESSILGLDTCDLQPRILKTLSQQALRTRFKAEVFTPSWICNKMNNTLDELWFGYSNVFNKVDTDNNWEVNDDPIFFPAHKKWTDYIDIRLLEITCGEAPFIVSRYDTSSGKVINPLKRRIGLLDRKLRVISENVKEENEWMKWVVRAYQSIYGYEWQGDNLLIARINLLMTFVDYVKWRWDRLPKDSEIRKIINIITWNIWQMDGKNGNLPYSSDEKTIRQMTIFDDLEKGLETTSTSFVKAKFYDWRSNKSFRFNQIREIDTVKKFYAAIGNPPFQDETLGDNKNFAPPVYHNFLDAAHEVADKAILIHPGRFLFGAGNTPKKWNEKMLKDPHLKVLFYEEDSKKVFANTDIKGGIAITLHDTEQDFGEIGIFTQYSELNSIITKLRLDKSFRSMNEIVISRTAYRLTDVMHKVHPEALSALSNGHAYDMSTNIFQRLPQIFFDQKPNDNHNYIKIIGRENNDRIYKYIRADFVNNIDSLSKFKVFIPKANGNGTLGEVLSSPIVGYPFVGATETFLSIGGFTSIDEAEAVLKYISTKFARILLGVLKVTQDITPEKWKYVPLQDFTTLSDIDWNKMIPEIDRQLYKKYRLSPDEITFIEAYAKEMD